MIDLIQRAQAVGAVLDEFIAIHNDVFRFKWRRLFPLGKWFEAIDFHGDLVALKSLEEELQRIRGDISAQHRQQFSFARVLVRYTETLEEATRHLRMICAGLDAKRSGSDTYTWGEYQRDCGAYKAKVSDYQIAGADLNREIMLVRGGAGYD